MQKKSMFCACESELQFLHSQKSPVGAHIPVPLALWWKETRVLLGVSDCQPSSTYSWTLLQGNNAGSIRAGHPYPPLASMHALKHACVHIAHSWARDGSLTPMIVTPFEVWLSRIINRISNKLANIYKMRHPVNSTITGSPAAGRYLVGYETQLFTVFYTYFHDVSACLFLFLYVWSYTHASSISFN